VSYIPYLLGAALSWCGATADEKLLVPVLSREIFRDRTRRMARAALDLGLAHRKLKYSAFLGTPLGTAITAPVPQTRELMCRDGLKYYARIPARNIEAAQAEVEAQRAVLHEAQPQTEAARTLAREFDLAARMAAESCRIMLWQQAVVAGRSSEASRLAAGGLSALQGLDEEFTAYWPLRNKGTPAKCSTFLRWRMEDYRRGTVYYPPEVARQPEPAT
jgi:hypothetical protein